uniref:Uncharacterized protein n=1 Tax=Triticum urartu TaxID=4572 RepID=A0A8R7K090_TRIUA
MIATMASASCKRKDALLQKHHDNIVWQLENGEILKGRGKHQETTLAISRGRVPIKRPGDKQWGSHYRTLIRLHQMWNSVIQVLHAISREGNDADDRGNTSDSCRASKRRVL